MRETRSIPKSFSISMSFVIPDLIRDPCLLPLGAYGGAIATDVRKDGPLEWIPARRPG